MARLEEVTVVDMKWHGSHVVELLYENAAGRLGNESFYRDRKPTLEIATAGRPWRFDGDGNLLRLAKMNLAIRGIDGQIAHGDTFHNDRHPDLKADFILANPPFSISDWFRTDEGEGSLIVAFSGKMLPSCPSICGVKSHDHSPKLDQL
jgi:hypothetical protein